jgi:hypothetical protein
MSRSDLVIFQYLNSSIEPERRPAPAEAEDPEGAVIRAPT